MCIIASSERVPYIFYCYISMRTYVRNDNSFISLFMAMWHRPCFKEARENLNIESKSLRTCSYKDDFMESHTRTHTIKWDWSYYMRSVPKYLSILLQAPKEHSNSHSHKKLFGFYIAKVNMGSLNRTHKHTQICILSSCYHRTFSVNLQQKGVSMTWHWMDLVTV